MLFGKYQYKREDIQERGYSRSVIALDEGSSFYWIKWIIGVSKSNTSLKILSDKLRHLQRARHSVLPDLLEYGFDEEQGAYAIVYECLAGVDTLENKISTLSPKDLLPGLLDVVDCLKGLHEIHKISHGDIHPGNILIDANGQFFLVDFGLGLITRTLSQEKELVVFARDFAAPEKFNKVSGVGFPFQADVYSLGSVLIWAFRELGISIPETHSSKIHKLLAEQPENRPSWPTVAEILKGLASESVQAIVRVEFQKKEYQEQILALLKTYRPLFYVSPKEGENYLMDIQLGESICESVLWLKDSDTLRFDRIKPIDSEEEKSRYKKKRRWAKTLNFSFDFTTSSFGQFTDLTPFFQQWFELSQKQSIYRNGKKAFQKELDFYQELLKTELDFIRKKALRLQFKSFRADEDELSFTWVENENLSTKGSIQQHVDVGNAVNSEGFEYELSPKADRKQGGGKPFRFIGKPYEVDFENRILKIKDVEFFNVDEAPRDGFLFESTAKKEEEKKRQQDAINKVDKNEVQNMDVMIALFEPNNITSQYFELPEDVENVRQKDESGKFFQYSPNQTSAILNAIHRKPLTVIQGPPGTGKTTVITEIVFQLLHARPESKILITSQTNNAVDQVLEGLLKNEIPVLRLRGIRAPNSPKVAEQTLDKKLEGWKKAVKQQSKAHFEQLKKALEKQVSAQASIAWSFVKIIQEEKDWLLAKNKIEIFAQKSPSLKPIHQLSQNREEGLRQMEEVFGISVGRYFELKGIHDDWISTVSSLDENSPLNLRLVDSVRVIGATCNHIAARKYTKYNFEFDYVIMDEAGKATPAEALVPIVMGQNLLLVGDHRQLRPMLTQNREVEKWLRDKFKAEAQDLESWEDYFNRPSLFEKVIESIDEDYKTQLTECRRLPADAVTLTSRCFYEDVGDGRIISAGRVPQMEHNLGLAVASSLFFIDIGHHHKNEKDGSSKSSYNSVSQGVVGQLLLALNSCDPVKEYSIGVITGYSAQRRRLLQEIDRLKSKGLIPLLSSKKKKKEDALTISVVDQFQGLEKDIIILDLVKSGPGLDLGFLETPNRINVALSRHKRLLLIVGDYQGILNAKTRKQDGGKVALQKYLELIPQASVVKAEQIKGLFRL